MKKYLVLLVAAALLAGGCSSAERLAPREGPMGSRSVTQGGPQDIGHFRSIVRDGEVPRPSTIEPVGFFAEHAIDLPEADCGDSLCMHANLAVAPGIDRESNWTMAFVALNTPVDPRELSRPETHVVFVVESSAHTHIFADGAGESLRAFANELTPDDRVSFIRMGSEAEVLADRVAPTDPALAVAAESFSETGGGPAALYNGLARAAQVIEDSRATFSGAQRIILVTSGHADAGISDPARILALSDALAHRSVGISVIGAGDDYRSEVPMQISEGGGGSYYFAEDGGDLVDILTLEGRTSLFPLATEFELTIEPAPGYRVGRVYGARRAFSEQSAAHLASPVLMVGNRRGAEDITDGRRGGGGGLFVELIADPERAAEIGVGAPAFTARAHWIDSASGEPVQQQLVVTNALAPGANPSGMFPHFADPLRGKAFMMLNMYLSLRTTAELFHEGDCGQALGVPPAMQATYDGWQEEYNDPDIDADWALLLELTHNVQEQCQGVTPRAPVAPMGCYYD